MKAILLFAVVILLGCGSRQEDKREPHDNQIESIDIAPDDKRILLQSASHGATSIFELNADGGSPRLILKSATNELFSNPRYSPDGKKILFIKRIKSKFWEGMVCLCNIDGTDVEELTHGGELVTEALFSGAAQKSFIAQLSNTTPAKRRALLPCVALMFMPLPFMTVK